MYKLQKRAHNVLDNIENNDDNIKALRNAAECYCSIYDLCEGYKHAIRLCLDDQYNNHVNDVDQDEDTRELIKLLNEPN